MDGLTGVLERLGDDAYRDLEAPPDFATTVLAAHRRRRRRTMRLTGAVCAAVIAAATAAVVEEVPGSGHASVVVSNATGVPCAEPPAAVSNALRWPCPQQTPDAFFDVMFDKPELFLTPGKSATSLDYRILGFGRLPNSRPGGVVVVGETWPIAGATSAEVFTAFASPAHYQPGIEAEQEVAGPNGPVPDLIGEGAAPAADPAMLLVSTPRLSAEPAERTCAALAMSTPQPRTTYLAACSDTVVVRSDITAIQLVRDGSLEGAPIPVTDGLAGLPGPQDSRPGWQIQGLDAAGNVVATIAWQLLV